ncbi:MAG TPA: hypothetical protein VGB44_10535, partial [Flavobacterium sp.]
YNYSWLYIAAGFLGFILIATIFFRQGQKSPQIENKMVIEEVHQPAPQIEKGPIQIQPEVQSEVAESSQKSIQPNQIQQNQRVHYVKEKASYNPNASVSQASSQSIAVNQSQEVQSSSINTQEILADAATSANQNHQKTKVTVDANALLSQVDGELELSFREKVIKTVGKKYNNVKVAVANRNQE